MEVEREVERVTKLEESRHNKLKSFANSTSKNRKLKLAATQELTGKTDQSKLSHRSVTSFDITLSNFIHQKHHNIVQSFLTFKVAFSFS